MMNKDSMVSPVRMPSPVTSQEGLPSPVSAEPPSLPHSSPAPRQNHVTTVVLHGVAIVCLFIDGKERLCLAQISNTLLKEYSYNEIHNRRVALGVTCVQCTPVQLEILRRAGAMPISSRRCGMITKREAERLVKSFLEDMAPPKLPENFAFEVEHGCGWGCRGSFIPSRYNSSRAKTIKCTYCNMYFSPNKFIFHFHRMPDSKYNHPDAANFNSWRRHLRLSDPGAPDDLSHAWEDVKAMFNGGTRKRMLSVASHTKGQEVTEHSRSHEEREMIKRSRSSEDGGGMKMSPSPAITPQQAYPHHYPVFPVPNKLYPIKNMPTHPAFTLPFNYEPKSGHQVNEAGNTSMKLHPPHNPAWPAMPDNMYPPFEMIWAKHLGLSAAENSYSANAFHKHKSPPGAGGPHGAVIPQSAGFPPGHPYNATNLMVASTGGHPQMSPPGVARHPQTLSPPGGSSMVRHPQTLSPPGGGVMGRHPQTVSPPGGGRLEDHDRTDSSPHTIFRPGHANTRYEMTHGSAFKPVVVKPIDSPPHHSFHPLEVVGRDSEPQLQVDEKYMDSHGSEGRTPSPARCHGDDSLSLGGSVSDQDEDSECENVDVDTVEEAEQNNNVQNKPTDGVLEDEHAVKILEGAVQSDRGVNVPQGSIQSHRVKDNDTQGEEVGVKIHEKVNKMSTARESPIKASDHVMPKLMPIVPKPVSHEQSGTPYTVGPDGDGTQYSISTDQNGTEYAVAMDRKRTPFSVHTDKNDTEYGVDKTHYGDVHTDGEARGRSGSPLDMTRAQRRHSPQPEDEPEGVCTSGDKGQDDQMPEEMPERAQRQLWRPVTSGDQVPHHALRMPLMQHNMVC